MRSGVLALVLDEETRHFLAELAFPAVGAPEAEPFLGAVVEPLGAPPVCVRR